MRSMYIENIHCKS